MKYDVVIVGAGLGGLTAGAKLAKEGRSVLIIDQHAMPGGYATTYKRKGSSVEVGLHVMDGLDDVDPKVGIFNDLGVFDEVELLQAPELYRVTNGGDLDFTMPNGRAEAEAALIARFPAEARGIRKFFRIISNTRRELHRVPRRKWAFYASMPFLPLVCPNVIFRERATIGQLLDRLFHDERLKLIFVANLAYYHDDPYTMSLLFYSLGQASYHNGGGHFIKGGSQVLSNHLASVIEDNGGDVVLRNRVEDIIVSNGKVAGVRYRPCSAPSSRSALDDRPDPRAKLDAVEVRCERVVANTAIPNLANGMISDEGTRRSIARLIDGQKISLPLISLYLGFDETPKEHGHDAYSTVLLPPDVKTLGDVSGNYHDEDYSRRLLIFVDYSQIDAGLDPEGRSSGALVTMDAWDYWESLDATAYAERKGRVTEAFIGQLDGLIPGIKSHVTYTDLGTPRTMKHYTMNTQGTAYGFAQIPSQAGRKRIPSKSPVPGLHFASAWSFPGHGFTGAILGGYWCAEEILRSRR